MKYLLTLPAIALLAVGMVMFDARPASAAIVRSGTTTLFSDHYEYDTVGSQPTSPEVGTWATANGGTVVTNAAMLCKSQQSGADGTVFQPKHRRPYRTCSLW